MSGLEIAAGIAGIASAFVTITRAIRSTHKSRKEKKLALQANATAAENRLLTTLDSGPPQINNEYDRDLARIGPAFAQGDGTQS
jgi:hypothetical protein